MGTDKALIEIAGSPILGRVLACLRAVSDDVFVVGDRAPYHQFGVPVYADEYPHGGPLGGIATALRRAGNDHVLVVACDMPFLSSDLLRALAGETRDYDVLLPVIHEGAATVLQTLHAVYARRCLPAIERQLASGDLRVASLIDQVDARLLNEGWIKVHDPDLRSFTNTNTIDDVEAARRPDRYER